MMARWHENLFPVCKELGISYVAFSPMANGALTGAYRKNEFSKDGSDFRANMPQYTLEGIKKTEALLEVLEQVAKSHNATLAQISLAWMINKEDFIIPIPGSRKIDRLISNYHAGNISLSKKEMNLLEEKLNTMTFDVFGGHK